MTWRTACGFAGIAAAITLGGCSDRADNFLEQIVTVGVGEIVGGLRTPAPPPPMPTREQLAEIPGPLLAIGFEGATGTGFIAAVNVTPDGYITYQDRTRRSVVLRGGLITGLQGFQYDLSSVKTQRDDPVVYQTPVDKWPRTIFRNYDFFLQSTADFQISVKCVITPIADEQIVVFQRTHGVVRIQEDCANDRRRFSNTYWVDRETGFVWKSQQWVGPKLRPAILEVLRAHPKSRVQE